MPACLISLPKFQSLALDPRFMIGFMLDPGEIMLVIPELHLFAKIYKDVFALQRRK